MEQYNKFIDANPIMFKNRKRKGRSKFLGEMISTYTTAGRTGRGITSRIFKVGVEKYPDSPIQVITIFNVFKLMHSLREMSNHICIFPNFNKGFNKRFKFESFI